MGARPLTEGAPCTARATFRFYAGLNDFLPPDWRQRSLPYRFRGRPAIKDPIEALGVPHPEVGLIVVDGRPVGFPHPLAAGERVAVYPPLTALPDADWALLRPPPARPLAFVLDVHLGKLARRLRLLGVDTRYRNDFDDWEIVRVARDEARVVLTRDRKLLCIGGVVHGAWLRATDPERQVAEVVERFGLAGELRPFTRCLECNGRLGRAAPEAVAAQVPAYVRGLCRVYVACADCGRVYWPGSHHARLTRWVRRFSARHDPA